MKKPDWFDEVKAALFKGAPWMLRYLRRQRQRHRRGEKVAMSAREMDRLIRLAEGLIAERDRLEARLPVIEALRRKTPPEERGRVNELLGRVLVQLGRPARSSKRQPSPAGRPSPARQRRPAAGRGRDR